MQSICVTFVRLFAPLSGVSLTATFSWKWWSECVCECLSAEIDQERTESAETERCARDSRGNSGDRECESDSVRQRPPRSSQWQRKSSAIDYRLITVAATSGAWKWQRNWRWKLEREKKWNGDNKDDNEVFGKSVNSALTYRFDLAVVLKHIEL